MGIMGVSAPSLHRESTDCLISHFKMRGRHTSIQHLNGSIRESVDSLCRDGADTPIVRVHREAFLTRERSRS